MHLLDGQPVLSASDLVGFLACEHLTQLELAALRGEVVRPERDDPELDVLTARGEGHEQRHLAALRAEGRRVVEVAAPAGNDDASLRAAERATIEAMAAGADVIYQAAFFDGRWRGQADFLYRVERPSGRWDFGYEPVDTKLARKVKAAAVLQLCSYADHLARLQGSPPEHIHVVTGDGAGTSLRLADFSAYYRQAKGRAEEAAFGPPRFSYPTPVEHCGICRWSEVCQARRRADDHLSLVAGMRRSQTEKLVAVGVGTVAELAASAPGCPPVRIGSLALERLRAQAALQVHHRATGQRAHELVEPVEDGRGLCLLPPPSPGDVFFDIEGDPFVGEDGLEYLLGLLEGGADGPSYTAYWGHDPSGEKRAFEAFVDDVMARLQRHPDLHVYHYGSYEQSALKRLMARHATREDEVDRLLRGGVLVDLYRVVRQGVRVSEESYSLKRVEHFYLPPRQGAVADARSSIVAYEAWLASTDEQLLTDIAAYNRDDCVSTWKLREWLEQRRPEAEALTGEPLARPGSRESGPSPAQAAAEAGASALVARLTAGIPDDPDARTPEQAATWLVAQLVGWHRREARPEWWAWFRRLELSDEELVDDNEAIGGLTYLGVVGEVDRSLVHRYAFPADQEHKIRVGDKVLDPRCAKACGVVVNLDATEGIVDLKRGRSSAVAHPTSVVPPQPVDTVRLREAVARVAADVAEHGIDGPGAFRAARELVLRQPPRVREAEPGAALKAPGEDGLQAALRLVAALDRSCLAVQGPPGAGKTFTGARMVTSLVARGDQVGVTANSHKAICQLLGQVVKAAAESGTPARILQKASPEEFCRLPGVERADSNAAVEARLAEGTVDVVAGTAWLFTSPDMAGRLGTLFVDEAGQFSLANAVAVAGSAANLVLLGDPQQLAQPARGTHPPGAGASALEHLLAGQATVPPDRGLFLEVTRRLHPDLCSVVSDAFYEGRLRAHPSCEGQSLDDGPWAGGTGLRFLPVEHRGNRTSSPEEVAEVVAGFAALLGRPWRDQHGQARALGLDDILVVAPYNSHVARLQMALPAGARVGTVDRFQGQEAAVVIFSMATSSAEDSPRHMEFLYSLNRLNVAVSRARALAVVVASPRLLEARCRKPGQLRLVNALCRLAEERRQPAPCA